ncbi:F0F1 ATP synthase subunit A [Mangrovibacterium sp.]|uniref:F0F1 ATP synthase subunit A n=1 Tax=Mangrovibacterium sp. TaxID=1961364 RepID=UPI003562132F
MAKLRFMLTGRLKLFAFLFVFATAGFTSPQIFAEDSPQSEAAETHEKSFDAGKFVLEHVSDAHEWHILSYNHHHVSIPLPVILYSKNSGLNAFWSSKFHHGTETYRNFRLEHEGEHEGKIIELNDQGEFVGIPLDISITKTVVGALVSVIVILLIFLNVAKTAKQRTGQAPTGIQSFMEPLIIFIRDEVAIPAIGKDKSDKFLPFLLTLFFFILINNFLGLIPIFPFGANVTGNIAVTMVLALFTFAMTTISGNKHYWKEIFNPDVPWWLKFPIPLMPIVELSGVITKPFVLMVRLFANMMAGHLIVTVFVSLIFIFSSLNGPIAGGIVSPISVAFSVFILLLDVLVSFIQAYVFTLLSALYFGMATSDHH